MILRCLFVAIVALATTAKAAVYVGPVSFQPGHSVTDGVTAAGAVTFAGPGSYAAKSWSLAGNLILSAPGDYTVNGSATISGNVVGPSSGLVTIRFVNSLTIAGSTSSNVTILRGPAPADPTPQPAPPLVNISTRIALQAGQQINPGFVVGGTAARRVLIRAIGPGLAAFNVSNRLAAPTLAVFSGETKIAETTGWDAGLVPTFSAVGAFALTAGSRDCALLLTLEPRAYTALVGGGSGEVLVEIYFVD